MKADQTYVFQGRIYLKGAEMPKGWKPPVPRKTAGGVVVEAPPEAPAAPEVTKKADVKDDLEPDFTDPK